MNFLPRVNDLLARTISRLSLAAAACALFASARPAAAADINNGIVRLGIRNDGSLCATPTNAPISSATGVGLLGIRYMPTNNDGTSGGATVDGWGVADTLTTQWGGGVLGGAMNLTAVTQTATASSAVSTATAAGILQVTHDFHPSTHPTAYEITVTVRNVSPAVVNALYRRTIDWDIEPTISDEYVTIQGATLPGIVSFSNGALLSSQNPLVPPSGVNGDVINQGHWDLGATITFDLGAIAPGASVTFNHYYGAAADRTAAMAAVTALGLTGYTLASPGNSPATIGAPNTFFFGFLNGSVVVPPPAPPPPSAPNSGPEGSHAGSHSVPTAAPTGGPEGTFGLGARSARARARSCWGRSSTDGALAES